MNTINRKRVIINEKLLFKNKLAVKPLPKSKSSFKEVLFDEYEQQIRDYLIQVDEDQDKSDFLRNHAIGGDYRAKMIDWMAEVMQTFQNDD